MSALTVLDYYFYWAFFVNVFRVTMYIILFERVTKGKVRKDVWENPAVREATYCFTGTIRLFMIFRAVITGWAMYLPDDIMKRSLVSIFFVCDLYMLSQIVGISKDAKGKYIEQRENSLPPFLIQLTIVIFATWFHIWWLVLGN